MCVVDMETLPITPTVKKNESVSLSIMNHFTSDHSELLGLLQNYADFEKSENSPLRLFYIIYIVYIVQVDLVLQL